MGGGWGVVNTRWPLVAGAPSRRKPMFSDDFWSESDAPGKDLRPVTLGSFFKKMAGSVQSIFAAKYAPDYPDCDALGEQVTLPEVLKSYTHRRA